MQPANERMKQRHYVVNRMLNSRRNSHSPRLFPEPITFFPRDPGRFCPFVFPPNHLAARFPANNHRRTIGDRRKQRTVAPTTVERQFTLGDRSHGLDSSHPPFAGRPTSGASPRCSQAHRRPSSGTQRATFHRARRGRPTRRASPRNRAQAAFALPSSMAFLTQSPWTRCRWPSGPRTSP